MVIEPVFVVGAPRSGVRLVYETLYDGAGVFAREDPFSDPFVDYPDMGPAARGWDSDRLVRAAPELLAHYRAAFGGRLRDRDDRAPDDTASAGSVRTLEFGLTYAVQVPFLRALFPRAQFVVVERDPRSAVSSLKEAWESGRFVTHRSLPGWEGLPWCFPLVEGWRELIGSDLLEIASRQWRWISEQLHADLSSLPEGDVVRVEFDEFRRDPADSLGRIDEQLTWVFDRPPASPRPLTRSTVSAPADEKWRTVNPELAAGGGRSPAEHTSHGAATASLFASTYSLSLLQLISDAECSLLVSGYQSGRLISLREADGMLNTHFVAFDAPMGIACDRSTLVVASRREIQEHQHHPGAARVSPPAGSHDACYLPRRTHVTGEMGVHEIVLANDELWTVSTRFSCLATLDTVNSFVPRWMPGFVTGLAAEDRCHLNGVAVRDGRVRYVTALGRTDEPGGWRDGKGTDGVLLDVADGEVIADGLAMPHSPRFHGGHLWVLESGNGTLARIDPDRGTVETVATLPGFTRGLAFVGRTALVGLSLVRDTVFRGLPVTAQADRACGVWAIDIDSGATLGWVRFEGIVQEIFDVQVCPWRHPAIAEVGDDIVRDSFTLP